MGYKADFLVMTLNARVLPIFLMHLFLNFSPHRYAAIRYCQSKTLPDYLTRGMLDIGVNFLTFEPLQPETLNALSKTVKNPWEHTDNSSDSDEEFMATQPIEGDILRAIGNQPGASDSEDVSQEHQQAIDTILSNSVVAMAGSEAKDSSRGEDSKSGETSQETPKAKRKRRTQKSSSAAGRKKPKTPATVDGEYRKWKVQYGPVSKER